MEADLEARGAQGAGVAVDDVDRGGGEVEARVVGHCHASIRVTVRTAEVATVGQQDDGGGGPPLAPRSRGLRRVWAEKADARQERPYPVRGVRLGVGRQPHCDAGHRGVHHEGQREERPVHQVPSVDGDQEDLHHAPPEEPCHSSVVPTPAAPRRNRPRRRGVRAVRVEGPAHQAREAGDRHHPDERTVALEQSDGRWQFVVAEPAVWEERACEIAGRVLTQQE